MTTNFLPGRGTAMPACALAFLLAVVIMAGTLPAQSQNINFPAPTTYDATQALTVRTVEAIATGDFNGDGKLDIVDLDSGEYLNVVFGNGDGTFQAPVLNPIVAANIFPEAIAVGDFNGDHMLDVAVWSTNSNVPPNGITQVTIYLGNGNGTFTAGATYQATGSDSTNPGPSSIVAADVNGDGKLDLIALSPLGNVYVLLGNGDGTFHTPVAYATGRTSGCCNGLAVGDLNGDGKPDLAVVENDGIGILLNAGSGTFGAATYYASGVAGSQVGDGIAIGDLNGDKKPDIVVTNETSGAIVFLNQGGGVFTESGVVNGPFVGATNNILLADINNDKKLDIVIPDSAGDVFTFYGKGNGTFSSGPVYPLQVAGSGNVLVALGDFNGDGALDLVDTDGITMNTVSLGRGDGSFQTAQAYSYTAAFFTGNNVVTADFNGDGIPDAAYSSVPLNVGTDRQSFAVMLGGPHGTLGAPSYIPAGSCSGQQTEWIATGDVNGDGKADVVATLVANGNTGCQNNVVAVLTGLGTGKFAKAKYYATGASSSAQEGEIYLVDVNGDGKLDIVTSNSDGTISVLLNKGNGTYNPGTLITSVSSLAAFYNPLAFADFNGDGKMDIAVVPSPRVSNTSSVYVLPGNGNGTFGAPIQTLAPVPPVTLAAADFNKDGKADAFVTTTTYSGCPGGGYTFLQGNGNGTFTPGSPVCLGYAGPGDPRVADFNGDGNLDVVIPYAGGTWTQIGPAILQGNGDGTFKSSELYYTGQAASNAAVADFNGDGMPDVVLLNDGGFNVSFLSVMLNATQPVSLSPLNVNYGTVTVGLKKAATVILTNDQKTSLAITSITLGGTDPGDFTEASNCGTGRKAGWDCTITVTFTPTATGARSATLNIKDAAGTQTVQLNGTGK